MIQRIDIDNLPADMSQVERTYLEHLQEENEDPSKMHSTIIRCWFEGDGFQPVRFYEPTSEIFETVLSEVAPIFTRTNVSPACECADFYYKLQLALNTVKSAVSTLQITSQALIDIKGEIPNTTWKKLKDLKGQLFFSQQEAADALVTCLQSVLSSEQIAEHGDTIMQHLQDAGIDEEVQQKKIVELQSQIDEFHGHVPTKPQPPTREQCPHCHMPHSYSLLELLPQEHKAINRIANAMVGAPIMFRDIPRVFEALELWLFASDSDLFAKKNMTNITMTNLLMNRFKKWILEVKQSLLEDFGESNGTEQPSTDSVLNPLDVPPPPPEPATPEGN